MRGDSGEAEGKTLRSYPGVCLARRVRRDGRGLGIVEGHIDAPIRSTLLG